MSTTTMTPEQTAALSEDARNRALRTFLQGLVIAVATAAWQFVQTVWVNQTGWSDFNWKVQGLALLNACAMAAAAYIMRRFVDPNAKIPTPLPPTPQPPPAEPADVPMEPDPTQEDVAEDTSEYDGSYPDDLDHDGDGDDAEVDVQPDVPLQQQRSLLGPDGGGL